MAYENCIEEIKRAAGRDLSDDELNDLLTELQKRQRQRLLTSGVDDLNKAAREAADDYAKAILEAAQVEKRNAALNLKARLEAVDFVKSQFKDKEALGLEAILVGVNRPVPGARLSAAAEQNQLSNFYLGGLQSDVQVAGLWREFVSGAFDRDIAKALWANNRKTPIPVDVPQEAAKIAELVSKWQEVVRQDANAAGANIKKTAGYIVRQSHDTYKIRNAGYETWRDAVMPKLNLERTFGGADPETALREIYADFASGVHLKTPDESPTGFVGPANLAKKVSQHRELHFKSADDWFDYNEQFGTGNLREALIRGFEWHAQSTGLMRKLGPNPGANLKMIADELVQGVDDPLKRQELATAIRGSVQNQLAVLDGTTRIPVNGMAARISSSVRVEQSLSKLGAALLSQFGDIPIYASEMRYQGQGMLSSVAEAITGLFKGRNRREMAEIDGMIGVAMDGMRSDIASRFSPADDGLPGAMSKLQQLFFKYNGMTWWTDTLRAQATRMMAHRLGLNKKVAFVELDPDLQRVLSLYNIDADRWDVIRKAANKQADGREYAVADTILDLPDRAVAKIIEAQGVPLTPERAAAVKREIADQLRAYYTDRSEYAVIQPDQRTMATMLRGTQPGTVEGEALRFMGQFKSFAIGMAQKALGREVYGRGANSLSDALRNGNGEMLGVANLVLWGAVFGYVSMSAKDLAKGRTPRDPTDYKTWMAALAQGGGAGIYGDFLFGEVRNRFGGGIISTIAGPTAGTIEDIFDLWGRVRNGDDVAAATFKTLISNTPFQNLFYTRIVLDYLILHQVSEWLNPGSIRRMEKRIEKENAQTFLVRPSQYVQ